MQTSSGKPFPLGSAPCEWNGKQGVNFALYSHHASGVELVLFCKKSGEMHRLPMCRTDDIWHLFVEGVEIGTEYGFRVSGEIDETAGKLFNPQKLLLDPYAKAIHGKPDFRTPEQKAWFAWNDTRDNAHLAPKSVVLGHNEFDWQGENRPYTPWAESIIYELHVKGFSQQNPAIPPELRGTFAGLAHPASIAHLKRLGITAVELLPISYAIDEPHLQQLGLHNYWGYNVLGHFAVDPRLASNQTDPLSELKQCVKTLHQAGIEVILDVVFNHTAEAGKDGALLCQRGIDNPTYYWLNEQGDYHNWTGCGNALNLSNPPTLRWVLDCLSYWATECHIDGFRFDLGAILGRTPDFAEKSAFLTACQTHSVLASLKLIAEPWDIGFNGYQLGYFPTPFAEWNDQFRDTIRGFFLHQSGDLARLARRFAGSDDLFASRRKPSASLNFITAHDGFTLHDLVCYNEKHNHANGEQNRDGHNHNLSYNFGEEGESTAPDILTQRQQAKRALLAGLLLANGTPMLLAGDEFGNSQHGNNNSYCQDNPISWLDWHAVDERLIADTAQLIALRKRIRLLSANRWWTAEDVAWLNTQGLPLSQAEWQHSDTKALQIQLENQWLILFNGAPQAQCFHLPSGDWQTVFGSDYLTLMTDTQTATLSGIGVCVLQRSST